MVFAAVRMDSRSRLMSRSADRDAPMALSCSRRWPRSSAAVGGAPPGRRSPWVVSSRLLMVGRASTSLLDADGADFLHVRHAHQALLHAVLLQRAHTVLEALRQHGGDARMLLDQLLQRIGRDEQLVQAAAALEAAAAALVAAHRLVEGELALLVAVGLHP